MTQSMPNITASVALDRSKAFDTVNMHTLMDRLTQTHMPYTILGYIANYIKGPIAYTTFGSHTSTKRQFKSGVPQGGVLSPILFSIYTARRTLCNWPHVRTAWLSQRHTLTWASREPTCYPACKTCSGGQGTTAYFSARTGRHAHYSPQTQQNKTHN